MEIISLDAHKRYSLCRVEERSGKLIKEDKIEHQRGHISEFLSEYAKGTTVAVETIGNWYWIVDEIEEAGMKPALVHARKAKLMMGLTNKTDRLDVKGLNRLQRNGTLPEVWIPPAELRDRRDLPRTRMVFSNMRTKIKNRIHSVLDKYALHDFGEVSDIFGKMNRKRLEKRIEELPPQTRFTTVHLLEELNSIQSKINSIEKQMEKLFKETPVTKHLMTLPGVGLILATVITNEMGDAGRFASSGSFASYSGTTPRVKSSGGKTRYGRLRVDINRYLKWAFSEAANSVALNREVYPRRHVSQLYKRIRARKGHQKAVGAVARHLAEAAYCVVKKDESYRERGNKATSSRKA